VRYEAIITHEPKAAPWLWENHTYEIDAPNNEELECKIGDLLDALGVENPGCNFYLCSLKNLSFRYVAQFASYVKEDDLRHNWKKGQELRRWTEDLRAQTDEGARAEAREKLLVFAQMDGSSSWTTKLIKLIKITEEVISFVD